MKRLQQKKLGIDVRVIDLLQEDVERFFAERRAIDGDNTLSLSVPEDRGNYVRAAIASGWISEGLTVDDVKKLKPNATLWLARELDNILEEAFTIPSE